MLGTMTAFSQQTKLKRLRPLADTTGYVIYSDSNGVWYAEHLSYVLDDLITSGVVDDSTDASGLVVVSHDQPDSTFSAVVTVTDTFTNVPVPVVVAKTSTTFTVKFYSAKDGAVFASDAIRFDWILKDNPDLN